MNTTMRLNLGAFLRMAPLFMLLVLPLQAAERPRLAVLTDIGGDPDDQQSLIRLMVYANQFEIEALIASASGTRGELKRAVTRPDLIRQIVHAYGQVLSNLQRHATGWPTADQLLRSVKAGNPQRGEKHIGAEHDTEGSRFLVERIDAGTPQRPLNITIWGGQTDLAQALWRVKHERGEAGFREFARKFRVFDISDQDGIADWMRAKFLGMQYILAKAPPARDKREGTYRGMYLTGDESLTSREWVDRHIRSAGPLGALYPLKTWTAPNKHGCLKEGDTPSWFFFLSIGGNDPADPGKPGWGGQYQREPDGWYRDLAAKPGFDPRETVSRWRPDFQRDFARRMAWCLPVPTLSGDVSPALSQEKAAKALPVFKHRGVVLDYKDLEYNPCNDIIIPSVIRTDVLQKPLGRYYMYYAPHNAPGGICLAYADAPEGPWKEYQANPLVVRDWPPHYKVSHVSGPHAIWIEEAKKLFVYYHGENDTTRIASTTDGIHFQYDGVAVTTKIFDGISEASYARVFRYTLPGKDNRYVMLLMGNNRGTRKIYLAWSKDGRTWEPRRTPFIEPKERTGQLAQAWYLPWQGNHYLIYHDYSPEGTDLHVSAVDPAFEHVRYIGMFYDRRSASQDNVAQMSPCFLTEGDTIYMYTNIGPRLNQKIALAATKVTSPGSQRQPAPSENR